MRGELMSATPMLVRLACPPARHCSPGPGRRGARRRASSAGRRTGDAPLHRVADADVPAGAQRQLLDQAVHALALDRQRHAGAQLQLRGVQQHVVHREVVDERVCARRSHCHAGETRCALCMLLRAQVNTCASTCPAAAPYCSTYPQWRRMNICEGRRPATSTCPLSVPSVFRPASTSAQAQAGEETSWPAGRCPLYRWVRSPCGTRHPRAHPAAWSCRSRSGPSALCARRVSGRPERSSSSHTEVMRCAHQRRHRARHDAARHAVKQGQLLRPLGAVGDQAADVLQFSAPSEPCGGSDALHPQ